MAFAMFWEILWALILGFALSGAVQAVVAKKEMSRLLPDDSPHTLIVTSLLGAAAASCSYAAVARRCVRTRWRNCGSANRSGSRNYGRRRQRLDSVCEHADWYTPHRPPIPPPA